MKQNLSHIMKTFGLDTRTPVYIGALTPIEYSNVHYYVHHPNTAPLKRKLSRKEKRAASKILNECDGNEKKVCYVKIKKVDVYADVKGTEEKEIKRAPERFYPVCNGKVLGSYATKELAEQRIGFYIIDQPDQLTLHLQFVPRFAKGYRDSLKDMYLNYDCTIIEGKGIEKVKPNYDVTNRGTLGLFYYKK